MTSETLTVEQAAAFLGLHPDTLRERAAAGIIRGAKPGKRWIFRRADLDAYLDGLADGTQQPAAKPARKGKECRSTGDRARTRGMSQSATPAGELDALLRQRIAEKRKGSMTSLRLVSGSKSEPGSRSPTPSSHGSKPRIVAGKN